MKLPCATSRAGPGSPWSGGLVQSEPCLTQTGLDRGAPCHVRTFCSVFTHYSIALPTSALFPLIKVICLASVEIMLISR